MMVLIVNNKIVGSGFSEGWLESELNIVLGDCGGVLCEDGKKLMLDGELDDEGNEIELFMSSDFMVELLIDEGSIINIFDSNDKILYIGVSKIDLNDEL